MCTRQLPQFPPGEVAGTAGLTGTKGGGWGADPLLLDKSQAPCFLGGPCFFFFCKGFNSSLGVFYSPNIMSSV